jgi:hypothetical protein
MYAFLDSFSTDTELLRLYIYEKRQVEFSWQQTRRLRELNALTSAKDGYKLPRNAGSV